VCAACWFHDGDGVTRLKAPSTSLRAVASALISIGVPIKPSQTPPHRSRPTSRDFVHWCFSNACRWRVWMGSSCRRPKSFTRDEIATAIARCAGWLADSVVTGESIDSGEGRATHYGGSSQIFFNR
jgi:hypothetical protein